MYLYGSKFLEPPGLPLAALARALQSVIVRATSIPPIDLLAFITNAKTTLIGYIIQCAATSEQIPNAHLGDSWQLLVLKALPSNIVLAECTFFSKTWHVARGSCLNCENAL